MSKVSCYVCHDSMAEDEVIEVERVRKALSPYDENNPHRGWSIFNHNDVVWVSTFTFDTVNVCDDCASTCQWCLNRYIISDARRDDDIFQDSFDNVEDISNLRRRNGGNDWAFDRLLCRSCGDDAFSCDNCREMCHVDDMCSVYPNDQSWCENCRESATWCENCECYWDNDSRGCGCTRAIHDYSYKPDPKFWLADGSRASWENLNGHVFMGFELEVESNGGQYERGAEFMVENSNNESLWYLKHDGSLNYGFEIVSHPMELEYHQSIGYDLLKELAQKGFSGFRTDTCGLHVHVSRAGFSGRAHILRFAYFAARNSEQMIRLAGRNSERWANFSELRDQSTSVMKRANRWGQTGGNRYNAINFNNHDTLELRFFKSSLRPQRLLSALELTDAMVEYTRSLTVPECIDGGLDWQHFTRWLVVRETEYPNLLEYCKKFKLIPYYDNMETAKESVEQ